MKNLLKSICHNKCLKEIHFRAGEDIIVDTVLAEKVRGSCEGEGMGVGNWPSSLANQ